MADLVGDIVHPALVEHSEDKVSLGGLLEDAHLPDHRCLGVVLQGAALLAHLERGGRFLAQGWHEARLSDEGLLSVSSVQQGRASKLIQIALSQLLRVLFRTESEIAGRGEARSAGKILLGRWQQTLAPLTAEEAVRQILAAAPFLWQETFAVDRSTLAAAFVDGGQKTLWVVAPGRTQSRFLRQAKTLEELTELLSSDIARDLWDGWQAGLDPAACADRGEWQLAIAGWQRQPPQDPSEVRRLARCFYEIGSYSKALQTLQGQKHREARLLRIRAQLDMGELGAARLGIGALAKMNLSPEQSVELSELAIRFCGQRRHMDEYDHWIARGLEGTSGKVRLRALLMAAGAEWDRKDMATMTRYLDESKSALDDPALAGKWHRMRGLQAQLAGDGSEAVEQMSMALRLDRKKVSRVEAGRLWNELMLCRDLADDLASAEKAGRHAYRLMRDCDGPSPTTLTLYNLAEIRLRRGKSRGVASVLESSTANNRRSKNYRGLINDLELWARLELAQGRSEAALARCSEAFQTIERRGLWDKREVFELFSARAHGWLGRQQEAADCLGRLGEADEQAMLALESEERPAVWALAGRMSKALAEAQGTPWASLWTSLASSSHPTPEVWEELRRLEAYRAARLVFDCELVLPGVVPPHQLRKAVATLGACGAGVLAETLESRSSSSWRALERYAELQTVGPRAIRNLFVEAGYSEVSLKWIRARSEEVLLRGGEGSDLRMRDRRVGKAVCGGHMELRASGIDSPLETLFAIVRRDYRPSVTPEKKRKSRPLIKSDIVGECEALQKALSRLDRLAEKDFPLLILGESGTGKELVARRAHNMSGRRGGPFCAINSAALPSNLIEAELFGHVKGSFTGATKDRKGLFENASAGTVFLDEIGDLPVAAQAHLLRVLQEGEIQRVGESYMRKVDVRIVAATHRNLEEMVARGTFRQDLFFRLKVATVELPPLRDRGDDVLLLAQHFLATKGATHRLSKDAQSRLRSYRWPGNVRELENVLDVAMTLAEEGVIRDRDLDLPEPLDGPQGTYHQLLQQYRKDLVSNALSETKGNQAAAARHLGLTRQALSYLVKQLGLS